MVSGEQNLAHTQKRFYTGHALVLAVLLAIPIWVKANFGEVSFDQVVYHFQFGSQGVFQADSSILLGFLRDTIVIPCILVAVVRLALRRWPAFQSKTWFFAQYPHFIRYVLRFLIAAAVLLNLYVLSVASFIGGFFGKDYFSQHYISPREVSLSPRRPKNLILIYVEGLEQSYESADLFGRNLLQRLSTFRSRGFSFANYVQMPGTNWTIASMVATQCGLPLKSVSIFDGNAQGEAVTRFFPGATCLGDILANHGYRNVFLGGASLAFAGKGKFLRDHGYTELFGKEEWLAAGYDESGMNGWGLHDDDLLKEARRKTHELHRSGQPFNLTLLTVDTHHPEGHLSPYCRARGYAEFDGIVECTAEQVANYIGEMIRAGYLRDTSIVVLGDHLSMGNPLQEKLAEIPGRAMFNLMITTQPKALSPAIEALTPFDMLPTLLEISGFFVKGGRLGLGYSLFRHRTVPPPDRMAQLAENVMNRSWLYDGLLNKRD